MEETRRKMKYKGYDLYEDSVKEIAMIAFKNDVSAAEVVRQMLDMGIAKVNSKELKIVKTEK